MFRRTRYQHGSVQREKRRCGPDVWTFRWREISSDGKRKQRKAIIGTVTDLTTEASALKAAHALRINANQQTPQAEGGPSTIAELVAHYRLKELTGDSHSRKAFSTRSAYEYNLKNWILPRWGGHRLDQIKPVAVEEWLDGIRRVGTRSNSFVRARSGSAFQMFWNSKNYNFFSVNLSCGNALWFCWTRRQDFARANFLRFAGRMWTSRLLS